MRLAWIAPLLASLALAACGGAPRETSVDERVVRAISAVRLDPAEGVAALNAYRASRGLGAVRLDPALTAMAQRQADAMVAANEMSHNVAGGFASRLAAAGVGASEAGENLGGGYYSVQEAMTGWRNSPEHDANLRLAAATRMGVAIAKDPSTEYKVYWALELAGEPPRAGVNAFLAAPSTEAR